VTWWVASASDLLRIDPADDEVLDMRPFTDVGQARATSVAVGRDAVWVTKADGTLFRISPTTGLPIEGTVSVGGLPSDDRLWVVDSDGLVVVIDLQTRKVLRSIPIGGTPVDAAVGSGAVWIADQRGKRSVRIDATSLERSPYALTGPPAAIAIDEERGVIWVRTASVAEPGS
jgi:YVTN family beta-propeller protein